eukprot:COSAG02_NODE_3030_length_7514_cov_2.660418_3_plen_67_part_00
MNQGIKVAGGGQDGSTALHFSVSHQYRMEETHGEEDPKNGDRHSGKGRELLSRAVLCGTHTHTLHT